jgi:hypothetical protein
MKTPSVSRRRDCKSCGGAFPLSHFYTKPGEQHRFFRCRIRRAAHDAKYVRTDGGRARCARYERTQGGRARAARYNTTEGGRARAMRYEITEAGIARKVVYRMTCGGETTELIHGMKRAATT